jgi:nitroimidazol reductase NimA-like FMN-containing flavoprotein (pyridoxamine 5'-phosphate oxidase superfamily)
MSDGGSILEELPEEQCLALLAGQHYGRLAAILDGEVEIFPLNYSWSDGAVVFRTEPGTGLDRAAFGRVAFEVDGVDEDEHSGWSVIVKGVTGELNEAIDEGSEALKQLDVEPWAPGAKPKWVALRAEHVTGRRIRRTA